MPPTRKLVCKMVAQISGNLWHVSMFMYICLSYLAESQPVAALVHLQVLQDLGDRLKQQQQTYIQVCPLLVLGLGEIFLTLMLLVANLAITKGCKNLEKLLNAVKWVLI